LTAALGGAGRPPRVVVVGVGNEMRRDDGAGFAAVERAAPRLPAEAEVSRCAGDVTRLLDAWDGADFAIVVDAARWPGASPGEVTWLSDLGADSAALATWGDALGTHGLGVAEVVRLGRALGRLPGRLDLAAIALADAAQGEGFSDEVERAVDRAAELVAEGVRAFLEAHPV